MAGGYLPIYLNLTTVHLHNNNIIRLLLLVRCSFRELKNFSLRNLRHHVKPCDIFKSIEITLWLSGCLSVILPPLPTFHSQAISNCLGDEEAN